jgi:hypothetical protein
MYHADMAGYDLEPEEGTSGAVESALNRAESAWKSGRVQPLPGPPILDADGRIRSNTSCAGCGYLLRGRFGGDPCPQCGRRLSGAAVQGIATDRAGRIDESVPCRRCGYDLRGLPESGACPECGNAVGWSLRGNLLNYSDPDWVERLALGARWLTAAAVIAIGVFVIDLLIETTVGAFNFGAAAGVLVGGVSIMGFWLVSTPEPGVEEGMAINVRRVVRWGKIAATTAAAGVTTVQLARGGNALGAWTALADLAPQVVGIVSTIALYILAARIAERIPDISLAYDARRLMWVTIALFAGAFVMAFLVSLLGAGGAGAAGAAGFGCLLGVVILIGFVVTLIWSIVLLFQFRSALMLAASVARSTWATPRHDHAQSMRKTDVITS